jgi:amino acid transporter
MSDEKFDAQDNNGSKETAPYAVPQTAEDDVEEGAPRPLMRALESRHMQMIAIGGAIGAGLFVGSGEALVNGGPASLVICYFIVGILLLCTMMSLGELAVMYPVNGGYYEYSVRFLDPSWGNALGWNYAISWMLTLPFEITAASLTIQYWNTNLSPAIFISIFLVVLIIIQVFGVRVYGEVEFLLAIVKIITCIGLIILGIIINTGGVPNDPTGYIGAKYWYNPGAFANGFKGFCAVFVNAVFAYSGTELVGLAAAETRNPRKSLPKAAKQVLWRVALFYIINLLIVGLNIPYTDPRLLGSGKAASAGVDSKASPFVLAISNAGIKVLPSIINAVVLISSLSVANSCTYASTRTVQALAMSGNAPRFLAYVDKQGRPLGPVIIQMLFGFLAYIQFASSGLTVFNWLLSIGSLSATLMYFSINLAHIRFRQAFKLQGRSTDIIPWKSPLGAWGSIIGAVLAFICLAAVFYSSLFAPGGAPPTAYNFFEGYLSAFILLFFLIIFKCWRRELWFGVSLSSINLDKGKRFAGSDALPPPDDPRDLPWWKRVLTALF